jgi:hypothetical protein
MTQKRRSTQAKRDREFLLQEELRDLRNIAMRLLQWGVTVLTGLQTAIFFLRKDTYERMLAGGQLKSSEYLPLNRYLVGTVFLLVVAMFVTQLTSMVRDRYKFFYNQLGSKTYTGVAAHPLSKSGRWVLAAIFFSFPVLDVILRFYIRFEIGLW